MAVAYEPVGEGLVANLAQPGGNITGVGWLDAELPGKRLEILKETVPQLSRLTMAAGDLPEYGPVVGQREHACRAAA